VSVLAKRLGLWGRTRRSHIALFLFAGSLPWIGIFMLAMFTEHWTGVRWNVEKLQPGFQIALLIAFVWLAVRRLNDQDRPGWLAVVPIGAGFLLELLQLPEDLRSTLAVVLLALLMVFLFLPGSHGPNRYGADPRGWISREAYEEALRRSAPPGQAAQPPSP
jgi:uncharacterized membrane protein YhaH (DUF805 family)